MRAARRVVLRKALIDKDDAGQDRERPATDVVWTQVVAKDLLTGQERRLQPVELDGDRLGVRLPDDSAGTVYEVTATLSAGGRTHVRRLWSHVFKLDRRAVVELVGRADGLLRQPAREDLAQLAQDRPALPAMQSTADVDRALLRLAAASAAEDGRLDLGELRFLLERVRRSCDPARHVRPLPPLPEPEGAR